MDAARRWSAHYGVEFNCFAEYPTLENTELARSCDAVRCTPSGMSAAMLEKFRTLGVKYITTRSVGFDHIDLTASNRLELRVSNTMYEHLTAWPTLPLC